ncbi:MAG: hypothetical protein MK101_09335 [Phycisphaerales bacterium]|nr:hypothetical protein [Phycisphaerales bacterium]
MTTTHCAVWARGDQAQLLGNAFSDRALQCALLGCDDPQVGADLAAALGAEAVDDVRQLLHQTSIDVLWLACPDVLDADLRSVIRASSVPVATSAPCREGFDPRLYDGDHARFIPLLRTGPAFHAATGCLEHLGRVHCMQVSASAGDHQTSLAALLLDCADLVMHTCGLPDEVFASHSGGVAPSADPAAGMSGHVTATMRFADGAAASITVSDGGGTWIRRATLLGEGGRVIITDEGVSWTDPDGHVQEAPPSESHATAGGLARWHLLRLAEGAPVEQPGHEAALLCEAIRLSCVTGQIEVPEHVGRMFVN